MATHRELTETSVRSSGRRDVQPLQATARRIVRVENPGSVNLRTARWGSPAMVSARKSGRHRVLAVLEVAVPGKV